MMPPPIDGATLALFAAFSVSITQLIKQEYPDIKNIPLYLISSGGFVGSALLFVFLPLEWHQFYLLMLGGISVPGGIGLLKEIRRDGPSNVTVTDAQEVNAEKGGHVSVTS